MQLVRPSTSWYEPGEHLPHAVALVCGLNVPGAHGVAASEPTAQNVPTGHIAHCSTLVITSMLLFLCVPPGHCAHMTGGGVSTCTGRKRLLCSCVSTEQQIRCRQSCNTHQSGMATPSPAAATKHPPRNSTRLESKTCSLCGLQRPGTSPVSTCHTRWRWCAG